VNYPPRQVQGFYKRPSSSCSSSTGRRASGCRCRHQRLDRRAVLPDARHPPHRRGVRARPRAQGAHRHGDRRGQDAHGHRALGSAQRLAWLSSVVSASRNARSACLSPLPSPGVLEGVEPPRDAGVRSTSPHFPPCNADISSVPTADDISSGIGVTECGVDAAATTQAEPVPRASPSATRGTPRWPSSRLPSAGAAG
jgi:hypothetical protein